MVAVFIVPIIFILLAILLTDLFDNVNLPAPCSTGYRPVWLDIQFSFKLGVNLLYGFIKGTVRSGASGRSKFLFQIGTIKGCYLNLDIILLYLTSSNGATGSKGSL